MTTNILLLGGTSEAREIAERLGGIDGVAATLSLAGRTSAPAEFPIPVRIGGFGGAEGLAAYLRDNLVDVVVDATHPYADRISANAAAATRMAGVPLIALDRPAWRPVEGDRWIEVATVFDAVRLLGEGPARTVFLPIGKKETRAFEAEPRHRYVIRSIEPFDPPLNLPAVFHIQARPPFAKADEIALMRVHDVAQMVVKNSGVAASYAKIEAARELGVEVIVIGRPRATDSSAAHDVDEVMARVLHHHHRVKDRMA